MQASIDFDGTLTGSIAGGGGGGSDVSITPTYNQGTKIADYSIDGNEGAIYTPEIEISKNVLSGVKICEIEGVEIYCPSYGYIDTLGDSNVEQIGGFSEGLNVTPVNVKKVSYTNDITNGEKIGALTVGDSSFNVYQKPNANINYSTTEQDTGVKWIDGNPIYQLTVNYSGSFSISTGTSDYRYYTLPSVTIPNIKAIINVIGSVKDNSDNRYYPIPYYRLVKSENIVIIDYYEISNNELTLAVASYGAVYSSMSELSITFQYVKAVV